MTNKPGRVLTPEEKARRIKYRKQRKIIFPISRITFLLTLVSSIVFFFVLKGFGLLPGKWLLVFGIILLLINIYVATVALMHKMSNKRKLRQSIISAILSILMIVGSIALPSYKGKIARIFNPVPKEGELNINVYTLKESGYNKLEDLAGRKVGTQKRLDRDAQDYAITQVNRTIKSNPVVEIQCDNIYDAVEALYSGNVAAIMMNETYVNIIKDNADYTNFLEDTNMIYQCAHKVKVTFDPAKVGNITKEPFIIGIVGNDEWVYDDLNAMSGYRTDVNMLVAVNPTTKQALIISIPRDSYVALEGNYNHMDKLTHASTTSVSVSTGLEAWMKTVENLFGCDMNYFVKINFASMVDIVEALGGVDLYNPYEFTAYYEDCDESIGYWEMINKTFPEGELHLNGRETLAYCRERYSLPNGDFGRNEHQTIVLKALVNKVTDPSIISKIDPLLKALQGKFMTNMDINEMFALAQMQLDDLAVWDIQSYAISGDVDYLYCWVPDEYLSVVDLYDSTVSNAAGYIQKLMNNEKILAE